MKGIGTVSTRYGRMSGVEENGITCFKGVPYAMPPVGELRWRAPLPPSAWEGVRECDAFSAIAWQLPGQCGQKALDTYPQSEDCLYLNIWTPARSPEERLPVLVWIHGGAFLGGLGQEELYHGWKMAAKGVIVVSINYRLGVLGYLAHPQLTEEAGTSGNYGLLDQIQALTWVKENIRSFGGDPNRITVDGQSAGGMSVCSLLASPLTHGLLSGAIIQSGGPQPGRGESLAVCERAGMLVQEALSARDIAAMRRIDPAALIRVSVPGYAGRLPFQPCVDGKVLPCTPYEAFLTGRISKVPILFGCNAGEGLFAPRGATPETYASAVENFLGEEYREFCRLYPITSENFKEVSLEAGRDQGYANLRVVAGRLAAGHPCPVYFYYFMQGVEMEDGTKLPAGHSGELFYVFDTLHCLGGSTVDGKTWTPVLRRENYVLSDTMCGFWAAFAEKGTPEKPGLPDWPAYTPETDVSMHFEAGNIRAQASAYPERIDFFTRVLEKKAGL
ncbi:MAG: carboxylesterase/lipase family protein [Christensenellales bacterium]